MDSLARRTGDSASGEPQPGAAGSAPGPVLALGPLFLDVVMGGLEHAPRPGEEQWVPDCALTPGGVANQAVALSRFGLATSVVTHVGRDAAGRLVEAMLAEEGVGLDAVAYVERQSVSTSLFFDGDRAMTTFGTDAAPPLAPGLAPAALLADLAGIADSLDVVRAWRESSTPTWVLGDVGWDPTGRWDPGDLDPLHAVDVFTPNDAEARHYTRADSVDEAARMLAKRVGTVVVTCGAHGAVAIGAERISLRCPAVRAVDTTGAGDTFSAALTWAHLHGLGLRAALSAALLAATLTVVSPGGASSAPRPEQLAAFARSRRAELEGYDLAFLDLL